MVVSVDKTRIGGSKVRSGCSTCKARRVKCDEAKPGCNRCQRAGRRCEGYAASLEATKPEQGCRFIHYVGPTALNQRPIAGPSTYTDLDAHALRSLDFFNHFTAFQLKPPYPTGTWTPDLLCLMHAEPAVKHGMIALAALHENYQGESTSVFANQRRILALEHYGKSISRLVQLNTQDGLNAAGPTLLTSVLYCAIESLQGHFQSALKHITAGARLVNNHDDRGQGFLTLPDGLLVTLRQVCVGLCTQAMALGHWVFDPAVSESGGRAQYSKVCSFTTIEQALTEIARLMNDVMRLLAWEETMYDKAGLPNIEVQAARNALLQRYHCWDRIYQGLSKDNGDVTGVDARRKQSAFLVVRINQLMTWIMLNIDIAELEAGFDHFTDDFEAIVSAAEQLVRMESQRGPTNGTSEGPTFCLTLGIVPALFSTCFRCRNHSIRHRALAAMKASRRRESVWDTGIVAAVAEKILAYEEAAAANGQRITQSRQTLKGVRFEPADSMNDAEWPPEPSRVKGIQVNFLASDKSAKVSMLNMVGSKKHSHILVWDG